MFRAEIQWLADGPTLKMAGKLVGEWAEEARSLVTTDVVPKGLIVDLTDVSYIDSAGQRLLIWLGSVGAVFVATNVYAAAICERLGLVAVLGTGKRRNDVLVSREHKVCRCSPSRVSSRNRRLLRESKTFSGEARLLDHWGSDDGGTVRL